MAPKNTPYVHGEQDSSAGHAGSDDLVIVRSEKDAEPGIRLCLCGCGGVINSKSGKYLPGHDAKFKGKLIRAAIANVDVRIIEGKGKPRVVTPLVAANEVGFKSNVENAIERAKNAAMSDDEKAKIREQRAAERKTKREAQQAALAATRAENKAKRDAETATKKAERDAKAAAAKAAKANTSEHSAAARSEKAAAAKAAKAEAPVESDAPVTDALLNGE